MTDFDEQAHRQAPVEGDLSAQQAASDDDDLVSGLRGLSAMVSGGRTLEAILRQVAEFAALAIPGAGDTGVGVTVIKPVGTTMGVQAWAATTAVVHEIDLMQYEVVKEGPCITCMQTRRAAVSGSLGSDERWPRLGPRIARLGVASALALPLLIDEQVVGSINAYARDRDVFGEHAVRLGTAFATAAAVSAYNTQLLVAAQEKSEHLQRALVSRKTIDEAIGIIRSRTGATEDEAFERLKRISQTENTKLATVAQNLVDETVRRARERRDNPASAPPSDS